MKKIVEVKNLTKRFGSLVAVDGVSFEVSEGEVFAFLGPNGAGKTTTINMLITLLRPDKGEAFVDNFSVVREKNKVRKSIGVVFQDPTLDERLTAEENLKFHAYLYGVDRRVYRKRLKEVLDLVGLWERRKELVKRFSGGMKRRLEIARGLIHYPKILFLDEPTIGLDPQNRARIWEYILSLQKEKNIAIFMTTHYMNEAEYAHRVAIIDYGKIIALDTPEKLKKMVGREIIKMKVDCLNCVKQKLASFLRTEDIMEKNNFLYLKVKDGEEILNVLFKKLKIIPSYIEIKKPTLEDVFLSLTGREIRDEKEKSWKEIVRRKIRFKKL